MLTRLGLFCACLLVASSASADAIVVWQSDGELTSTSGAPWQPHPEVGTPYSLTMSFNPSLARPTEFSPAGSGCMEVDLSVSLTIGGHTWAGSGGLGYTRAQLPASNCAPGSLETQFSLHNLVAPTDSPWDLSGPRVFLFSYRDLFMQDAFPDIPTPIGKATLFTATLFSEDWGFVAEGDLRAVDQISPVPEPGTLTLLGVGLAFAARRARRART